MQDRPLLISSILRHGQRIHGASRVVSELPDGHRVDSFATVGADAERLAKVLTKLGVKPLERVATLCWNSYEHLVAYFGVSGMGAVLHTLNLRLFPEQLAYVIKHAEDKVILVEDSLLSVLAKVASTLDTVEHIVVIGDGDTSELAAAQRAKIHRYSELMSAESAGYDWPDLDERTPSSMCYTSGTTGNPKGVVYSHRSTYLHTLAFQAGWFTALSERDTVLPLVQMFHANAWGIPYACFMSGADIVLAGRFLQPDVVARMITRERPTVAFGVPTLWTGLLNYAETAPLDLSSIRVAFSGGSAVPESLMRSLEARGVRLYQLWGMTETSPMGAVAIPPPGVGEEEAWVYRSRTGRVVPGVELRLIDDAGAEVPWDGRSVGEIEVRGPWITGSYYGGDDPTKFHDGWLRTGDIASVDAKGYLQITDRAKDVVKSGGEWISSVELENLLMAHPSVLEAAVIGVPDAKWDERPLACVVSKPGATVSASVLRDFLMPKVARFWVPERFAFIDEVPKTSVGKFDKKVLRDRYSKGLLAEESVGTTER